jgi:hypothetical protein
MSQLSGKSRHYKMIVGVALAALALATAARSSIAAETKPDPKTNSEGCETEWHPWKGITLTLPDAVTSAINAAAGRIGLKIISVSVGAAQRLGDCCDSSGGHTANGATETKGTVTAVLGESDPPEPIWGTPTLSHTFNLGFARLSVDIMLGLFATGEISLEGNIGYRDDSCLYATIFRNCWFGDFGLKGKLTLAERVEAILCGKTWFSKEHCAGISVTPVSISGSPSLAVTYNEPACNSGLHGKWAWADCVFVMQISLAGFGSYSWEIELPSISGAF